MTVYVSKLSTSIQSYHTNEDCYRLKQCQQIHEIEEDHSILSSLDHYPTCEETQDYSHNRDDELNQTIDELKKYQGDYFIFGGKP